MRIIPVVDLKGGIVVHAVAGRRDEYQPIRSVLADSARPLELVAAIQQRLNLTELYVADLDAIAGGEPGLQTLNAIGQTARQLIVDAGVRDRSRAEQLLELGVSRVVLSLESLPGPTALEDLLQLLGSRATFSLDLRGGEPLGPRDAWDFASPLEITLRVIAAGVREIIVLDLAQVGTGAGLGTESLCRAILERHPAIELIAGGGVRSRQDLDRLRNVGLAGVLVATALHRGDITCADLE